MRSRSAIGIVLLLGALLLGPIPLLLPPGVGQEEEGEGEEAVPQVVIVPPAASKLEVKIWTDFQLYTPGEPLRIHLRLNRDAYVYVYNVNPAGRVTLLFPNAFSPNPFLQAGEHVLPDKPDYSLVVEKLYGVETLQVLALLKPLPLLEELSTQGWEEVPFPPLRGKPEELKPQVERLIRITVEPDEWAADWAQFVVGPAVAHLSVTTDPPGARVLLNGKEMGTTPLTLDLEPGQFLLVLRKEGYRPWLKSVRLGNGTFQEFSVALEPEREAVPPAEGAGEDEPSPEPQPQPQLQPPPEPGFPGEDAPPADEGAGPPLRPWGWVFGLNAGLNGEGVLSLGAELGLLRGLILGGSVSLTADEDIPEYFDIGAPTEFENEEVYNLGPETEAYLKLSLPLGGTGIYAQLAGGIAVQERVHIAVPGGVIIVPGLSRGAPQVEILPNGYRETVGYLTAYGGVALAVGGGRGEGEGEGEGGVGALSVGYHTRRGWVVGLSLRF